MLSYLVAHRGPEIGVRMALGARRSDIGTMVLRETAGVLAVSLGIGLAAAALLARSVSALLFEVSATDVGVFTAVPLALVVVALAASWGPARRAARLDPLAAMRATTRS